MCAHTHIYILSGLVVLQHSEIICVVTQLTVCSVILSLASAIDSSSACVYYMSTQHTHTHFDVDFY